MTARHPLPAEETAALRRARCPACLRAQAACVCAAVRPLRIRCGLLVLQHPQEVHEAKNTGRLLHLCLPGSRIACGEQFDDAELARLLGEGAPPVLLYPPTPGMDASLPVAGALAAAGPVTLVLLDATWRKSRKMLALNPRLQQLPRLVLQPGAASLYAIRRAHAPHQLSTLEAGAQALAQLEEGLDVSPLLDAMRDFVAQRQAWLPA